MLEVYCDSSYNENEDSYIGCLVLRGNKQVHQSTTKILTNPLSNLECELEAIRFAVTLARIFSGNEKEIIIYNDSTEAVKTFQAKEAEIKRGFLEAGVLFHFEYIPREKKYQVTADSLSKKFPVFYTDSPAFDVESFSRREDILSDIAHGGTVFYLEKVGEKSTNKKTCYRLVARSFEKILSSDLRYLIKKGGQGTQIKVAEKIRSDLEDPEIRLYLEARGARLENSYFLLTDETWGLRGTDSRAYSIFPSTIPHKIICDEVDRSPENLFRKVERFK